MGVVIILPSMVQQQDPRSLRCGWYKDDAASSLAIIVRYPGRYKDGEETEHSEYPAVLARGYTSLVATRPGNTRQADAITARSRAVCYSNT